MRWPRPVPILFIYVTLTIYMHRYYKTILFSTVFTTGAAVLIFEIAAVRSLSPYFGASIYVVSSVLTVILAALSLGYYFGGRLADRYPNVSVLYIILVTSGLVMNLLVLLSKFVFPFAGQLLPITLGPLILSRFFFFLPAFMLGVDSPFVIKLLTRVGDDNHNGAIVGSTFFWSTLGSIVGSLASGFLLIPLAGLELTLVGTATALSLLAYIAHFALRTDSDSFFASQNYRFLLLVVLSILVASITFRTTPPYMHAGKLLHQSDGLYSQIEVREYSFSPDRVFRVLHREVNSSSAIELGTTTQPFQYTDYVRAYNAFPFEAKTALFIGGGAYTMPRTLLLEDPGIIIDVVEIEPSLFPLAQQYFELPVTDRLTNHPLDARVFLNRSQKKYDLIFVDAFQSGLFIPPHLSTAEFFDSVKDSLNQNGLVIVNIIGQSDHRQATFDGSIIKTINSVYPNMAIYSASDQIAGLQNFVILARQDDTSSALSANFLIDRKDGRSSPATEFLLPLTYFNLDKQIMLTDNLNPAELLLSKRILKKQK